MRRQWKILVAKEEPYKTENVVNYINEALEANVVLKKRALYAKRDIKQGEDFFLSYPKDYCRNYILKI